MGGGKYSIYLPHHLDWKFRLVFSNIMSYLNFLNLLFFSCFSMMSANIYTFSKFIALAITLEVENYLSACVFLVNSIKNFNFTIWTFILTIFPSSPHGYY